MTLLGQEVTPGDTLCSPFNWAHSGPLLFCETQLDSCVLLFLAWIREGDPNRAPMEWCRMPLTQKTSLGRARSCSTSAIRYQMICMERWGLRGEGFLPGSHNFPRRSFLSKVHVWTYRLFLVLTDTLKNVGWLKGMARVAFVWDTLPWAWDLRWGFSAEGVGFSSPRYFFHYNGTLENRWESCRVEIQHCSEKATLNLCV